MKAQRYASLDLGSNSFLCLITEAVPGRPETARTLSDQVEIVRLGEGIANSGKFSEGAIERARACLQNFARTIQEFKCDKVQAVATAAARKASNVDVLKQICSDLDIPLEIISGEEEAQLTYQGAVGAKPFNYLLIDIGGGSTEFVVGAGEKLVNKVSVPWGCVNSYEHLALQTPNTSQNIEALKSHVSEQFEESIQTAFKLVAELPKAELEILAVAGTPTTLATVQIGKFDEEKINALQFSQDEMQAWFQKLAPLYLNQRIELGFPKGRADVIIVGLAILEFVLAKAKGQSLKVSTRGLRNGLMRKLVNKT